MCRCGGMPPVCASGRPPADCRAVRTHPHPPYLPPIDCAMEVPEVLQELQELQEGQEVKEEMPRKAKVVWK